MKFKLSTSKGITLLELIISMALAMIVLMGVSSQLIFMIKEDVRSTNMQELEQLRDIIRTHYNCNNTIAKPDNPPGPLKDTTNNLSCYASQDADIDIVCDNTANMKTEDIKKDADHSLVIALYNENNNTIITNWTHGSSITYANYVVRAICCDSNQSNNQPDPFIKVEARLKSLSETGPWQDIFEIVPLVQCFD